MRCSTVRRIIFALMLAPAAAYSQAGNATLTGRVDDPTGAVVSGAAVAAANAATGVVRNTTTNSVGLYVIPHLIPGTYRLTVRAAGFSDHTVENIQLEIDQQARVDATLKIGAIAEQVQVTAAPPPLQTEDASVGTVIGSQHVRELPLDGRAFNELLQLSPGTLPSTRSELYGGDDPQTAGRQRNGMPAFDVNGASAAFVNYRVDGIENNEAQFGGANLPISIDAIQEVKIQTANFSAEYGRGPTQVDAVVRSGANRLHGGLFEFVRNDMMDATAWTFTGPHQKSQLKRNQFGGYLGGPIRRDKLFYFFNYDGTREVFSSPRTVDLPTDEMRAGVFPRGVVIFDPLGLTPFPNSVIPGTRFHPGGKKMVDAFPHANLPGLARRNAAGFDLAPLENYFFDPRRVRKINQYNFRSDYNHSSRDTFFGRFTSGSNYILGDGPLATNLGSIIGQEEDDLGGLNIGGTWFHTFGPSAINELRIGVSTNPQKYDSVDKTDWAGVFGIKQFLSPLAPPGLPTISITGAGNISGGNTRPYQASDTSYQIVENLTLIKGAHTIRAGGEAMRNIKTPYNVARSRGRFTFSGVQTRDRARPTATTTSCPGGGSATACLSGDGTADALLGYPSFFEAGWPTPKIDRHIQRWVGFFNDTWRVRPSLTLTLGLRYEYAGRASSNPPAFAVPIRENNEFTGRVAIANTSDGKLSPLVHSLALRNFGDALVTCRSIGLPDDCVVSRKTDFQPRFGFAWKIDRKTVFRGGAGIFYGRTLGVTETEEASSSFPFTMPVLTPTFTRPPEGSTPPPISLTNPLSASAQPAPGLDATEPRRKTPSTYQWNLTFQRELPGGAVLDVSYVATLGRNLDGLPLAQCCYWNIPQPAGVVLAPGQALKAAQPRFGRVFMWQYQNTSHYEALQTKLVRRLSNGLAVVATYTFSKNLGISNGLGDPRFPAQDKGPQKNDVRHMMMLSPIWQIPVGAGRPFLNTKGPLNQVLGGWQLSGILTMRGGFPFTPIMAGNTDYLNFGAYDGPNRPDRVCDGRLSNPSEFNWFDKGCFVTSAQPSTPGALLRQGNSGVNILRGPSGFSLDGGLSKDFVVKEDCTLQFRFEAFNALNHPVLGLPNLGIQPGGNSPAAYISTVASRPRILQLALKLRF